MSGDDGLFSIDLLMWARDRADLTEDVALFGFSQDRVDFNVDQMDEIFAAQIKLANQDARRRVAKMGEGMDKTGIEGRRAGIRDALARSRAKQERLEEELERLEDIPTEDPYPDGAVLRFDVRFPGSHDVFTYAALRAGGLWYVTGRRSGVAPTMYHATWLQLVEWLVQNRVDEVDHMIFFRTLSIGGRPSGPAPEQKQTRADTKELPIHECGRGAEGGEGMAPHGAHIWQVVEGPGERHFWCPGQQPDDV